METNNEIEDTTLLDQYVKQDNGSTQGNIILAMGVGGGGCNAVAYMSKQGVRGVDFVVLNTDKQALDPIDVQSRLLLGPQICGGLGAGGKPEIGRAAAEESVAEIEKFLTPNVRMVFVTAGMGGGTGTGAAPIVAGVAKKRDILTVGIVTIPFFFEGLTKIHDAIRGAATLQENVDALLVINNDRIATIYPDMAWDEAFSKADDVLTTAARTISDMVTTLSNINIDMRDVDTCLRNGRTALISVGYGEGDDRMNKAINAALHSPLLCDTNIMNARELLFAFYYSHDHKLKVYESAAANHLVEEINKHVHIKYGWGFDDSLGERIKFSILASGFDMAVDTNGHKISFIEGKDTPVSQEETDWKTIGEAYGFDKVDEIRRRQETQNYYILDASDLDNDTAIAQLEATPAYKRDKRKVALESRRAEHEQDMSRNSNQTSSNVISFGDNDR